MSAPTNEDLAKDAFDHWIQPPQTRSSMKEREASPPSPSSFPQSKALLSSSPQQTVSSKALTHPKYEDDHWVSPFRKPSLTTHNQIASSPAPVLPKSNTSPVPLPPQSSSLKEPTPAKYGADYRTNPSRISDSSRLEAASASCSSTRQPEPFEGLSLRQHKGPKGWTPARYDSGCRTNSDQKASKTECEAARNRWDWFASPFGKLPVEIRLIIYEHALMSQTPITPRLLEPKLAETYAETARSPVTPFHVSGSPGISHLALLQTCRLINREASPVYYSSNTFRLTNAKDLLEFLQHVEPHLRNELRSLHIEGLLTRQTKFPKMFLDQHRSTWQTDEVDESLLSYQILVLSKDAKAAAKILQTCNHLRHINLNIDGGEELIHFLWLKRAMRYLMSHIESTDEKDWILKPSATALNRGGGSLIARAEPSNHHFLFPSLKAGQKHSVDIHIDPELCRKRKEMQSAFCDMAM